MVKSVNRRCVNCGLSLKHNQSHYLESNEVQTVIKQWITPRSVTVWDKICRACYLLAREALLQPDTSGLSPRVGHSHVCFNCGRSVQRILSITLTRTSELDRGICDIFTEWNFPLELKPSSAVCSPCWRRAKRAHLRACGQSGNIEDNSLHSPEASQDAKNQTKYPITPLVSQRNEDMLGEMEEAPPTKADASENVMECCDTSTTESVESDGEDLSTFNMYEVERSLKEDDNNNPGTEPAPIKTIASIQYSELHTIREPDLQGEGLSRASEPNTQILDEMQSGLNVGEQSMNTQMLDEMQSGVNVGEQSMSTQMLDEMQSGVNVGEQSMSTQILDEMQSGANVGELSKCCTIIVNVYNYLQNEYEWFKTRLSGLNGVREMSDIFARTADATGVSKRIVQLALKKESLKAIYADHSYNSWDLREDNDGGRVTTFERGRITIRSRVRRELSNNEQSSSKMQTNRGSVPNRKRRTNSEEDEGISDDENIMPPKRKSAGISVSAKPGYEEQLPFPAPIQLRVHGVMETGCKIEPVDDDPPAIDDDPTEIDDDPTAINDDALEAESWFRYHCEQAPTTEATETVFKTESTDDDYLKDLQQDPLELNALSLETGSAAPDTTRLEVKFECVDENMEMHGDYSICDPTPLYIKQELPE